MSTTTTTTPVQTQQAGVKVFVGNLAFKTNQAQLAEVFKSAGKILDANIISRGRRSMGYGFVTFENLNDAQNAVKEMHHKEIDGRQVNVEVARPKQEKPANQQNNNNAQGGNNNNNNNNNNQGQQQQGFRSIRRNTNYRGRGGRGGYNNNNNNRGPRTQGGQGQVRQNYNNNNNNNNNNQGQQQQGERRPPRRNNNFRGNYRNNNNNNQGQNSGKQEQTEPRQPRQPRQPKPQVEKTPSKTTLFVANLPWSVTDETFGQFLTKESIKFKKAFVARRRNGRSLGYGFVEFDTEEEQTKGISSIEKKQIDGRELTAKVALTDLSKMNIANNNNNNATTTTATTATTTTSAAPATTTAEKK